MHDFEIICLDLGICWVGGGGVGGRGGGTEVEMGEVSHPPHPLWLRDRSWGAEMEMGRRCGGGGAEVEMGEAFTPSTPLVAKGWELGGAEMEMGRRGGGRGGGGGDGDGRSLQTLHTPCG